MKRSAGVSCESVISDMPFKLSNVNGNLNQIYYRHSMLDNRIFVWEHNVKIITTSCPGNTYHITGPCWRETTGGHPSQRARIRSFYVFVVISPKRLLHKQLPVISDIMTPMWRLRPVVQIHNASVPHPTIHHLVIKWAYVCAFLLQNGELCGICLMHCGICAMSLL